MDHIVYRLDTSSMTETLRWKSMMLADGCIHLSSKQHEGPAAFSSSLEKKGLLEGLKSIPIGAMTQLSVSGSMMHVEWLDANGKSAKAKARFDNDVDAVAVANAVQDARKWAPKQRGAGKWKAVQGPVIALGIALFLTSTTFGIAQEIEAGGDAETHGRRRWFKQLYVIAADALGSTGTAIVGAVLCAAIIGFILYKLRKPPMETVWS